MNLKHYGLLVFTTTFLLCNLSAQKKRVILSDSSTVIIFNHSDGSVTQNKSKPNYNKHIQQGETNIIKIAPLGFITGVIPFYYEREFSDYLSVQGGVGFTTRNYGREVTQSDNNKLDFYNNTLNTQDIAPAYYKFDNRTPELGFMFSLQPRVYFNSDGLDGGFFGISYNSSRFNFSSNVVNGYNGTTASFGSDKHKEYENIQDIFVVFGHQALYDKLTLEYTAEAGFRNVNGSKYVAYPISSGGGNYTIQDGTKDYSTSNLYFNVGLKVGFHF